MSNRPYHHDHLSEALISAGLERAGTSGPSGIALRDLAKSVGVSPTAAYRHFPSLEHLVAAVSQRARERLAGSMQVAMDAVDDPDPAARAWKRLLASGRAYVDFATTEPELFATAFTPCNVDAPSDDDPDAWGLLVGALNDLADLGQLDPSISDAAPVIAWSMVHGLSGILTGAQLPPDVDAQTVTGTVLDAVKRALSA